MNVPVLPEGLRRAVERDLRPVRPLPSPWRRSVWAAVTVGAVWAGALLLTPLRSDFADLPMWVGWGGAGLQLILGLGLIVLALRQSVPGEGAPGGVAMTWLAVTMSVQVAVGILTAHFSPGADLGEHALAHGVGCMAYDATMALPATLVTFWLLFRALPTRAPLAGLLGGAGAGASADGLLHLICPMSSLDHVLIWHTGAILLLAVGGLLAGIVWERSRARRMTDHAGR